MSSSLLGKLASAFVCYKHIPSYNGMFIILHCGHAWTIGI